MSGDMQLVENKQEYPQFKSGRRSLREEFAAAHRGEPPRQASLDVEVLYEDAALIRQDAKDLTFKVASLLGGVPEMGPTKDLFRLKSKFNIKSGAESAVDAAADQSVVAGMVVDAVEEEKKDPSYNCDFSRSRIFLRNKTQIRNAIDMFGVAGVIELRDGTRINIREVENNFSTLNKRKAGIANLDVKITFEFTTADGEKSFHHHELQFMHKDARIDYDRSHKAYEEKRKFEGYRDNADQRLTTCKADETVSWCKKWAQFNAVVNAKHQERWDTHNAVREHLGLDELIGYQPCVSSKAKKLDNQGPLLYVVR